jgi:hypothetical protein
MMGIRRVSLVDEWQRQLSEELSGGIGEVSPDILAGVMGNEDLESIMGDFQKFIATPMMQMFQKEVVPTIREGYNLPGAFYSTAKSAGIARAGEEFISQRIAPMAFEAMEAFRGREVQRASIGAQVLGVGAGLSTAPTYQAFYKGKEKKSFGSLGGVLGALGGAAIGGTEGAKYGALFGEAVGGLF